MATRHPASADSFVRDPFTWLAYFMLAYFACLQALPGPAMPLLRDDLNLSYTVGGLHFSAMAAGMVIAGLVTDRLLERWGRRAVFWGGGGGMALGGLLFAAGTHPAVTILGAGMMGLVGTALMATVQSSLADHHGANRALALTESNVAAAGSTILPPVLVGGFERIGIGWQGALVLIAAIWVVALLGWRHVVIPPAQTTESQDRRSNRRLPVAFWALWLAIVASVAAEWSIVSWGADFLVESGGLHEADASLVMTLFFVAMMVGRLSGSGLARRWSGQRVIFTALGLALVGFVLFWQGGRIGGAVTVAGLFLVGLGIANLFPFLLSLAMSAAPTQPDLAGARVTLAAGLAILLAPQTLGVVADQASLRTALGIVFGLLAGAGVITSVADWLGKRAASGNS